MFPATPFASKRLCCGIPKEEALMLAAAVTNSTANWSSLSKVSFPISFSLFSKNNFKASKNTFELSARLHISCGFLRPRDAIADDSCSAFLLSREQPFC
uniref:SAE2 n=1 Tax=Arundo donax TaxID=35708 RepID=A0A0A9EHN5_ARUDO